MWGSITFQNARYLCEDIIFRVMWQNDVLAVVRYNITCSQASMEVSTWVLRTITIEIGTQVIWRTVLAALVGQLSLTTSSTMVTKFSVIVPAHSCTLRGCQFGSWYCTIPYLDLLRGFIIFNRKSMWELIGEISRQIFISVRRYGI